MASIAASGADRRMDAGVRLALAEFLILTEDAVEIANHAVAWLADHAGVSRALLLLTIDEEPARLVAVAGHGLPQMSPERFSVRLDESEHPLVGMLEADRPVLFAPSEDGRPFPSTPFGRQSFHAFPLRSPTAGRDAGAGLLLVGGLRLPRPESVAWLASLLGHRLPRHTRTTTERRLRRERELLRGIIDAVTDPIILTDTEGRMLVANVTAEKLLASRDDESEGRRRAVALNNMLFSSALSQSAMDGTQPWRREVLLVDPTDGSDLLFELLGTVTTDHREGSGIVSILRNVTDLRRATEEMEANYRKLRLAETEARAERDRLDLIIDSVADPILVADPTGNIVLMNVPAERLFTVAEAGSDEAQRIVRANDAHFSSFVSNLFFAGEARRIGSINLTDPATGRSLPVEAISGQILSEHGEVTAVVTILHDRTEELERTRLYEQLKRASDELEQKVREATAELVRQNELLRRQAIEVEQASALKSEFLANMSHELRTPLNAILGYTNMLVQGIHGPLSAHQKRHATRVDANARHLLALINDILDISRIEAGKMPLHVTTFSLGELTTEVMAELEPLITGSKLRVLRDVPDRLPSVQADRQKVKQILLNLLTNALKFTPQGEVRLIARYDATRAMLAMAVADTGIGIAESDREKIFEDFRQADSSPTREYGGAGLGLSICRRLAGMMQGEITLESQVGRGSTFTLLLPRQVRGR